MAKYISVDIEADGPIIGEHSMISLGAVALDRNLNNKFYIEIKPISDKWVPEALMVSGFVRQQTLEFEEAYIAMQKFAGWLSQFKSPVLLADNPGFDASWINYYFLKFYGKNPFGWSSRRIGDLFCGFYKDPYYKWKKHRIGAHTHNALDDATANAGALLYLNDQGLKLI
jgi:DNA polymerase III epsilon subunit-like protein